MKEGNLKGLGTKDVNTLKNPRYPQNKVYKKHIQKDFLNNKNKKIKELMNWIIG